MAAGVRGPGRGGAMGIVSTIPEKCKRCYSCVHACPAKAIKVEHGQAMVIEERCIACGYCVKVCAQQAKMIEDHAGRVSAWLAAPAPPVIACLAPSFPAAFHEVAPGAVVTGLRRLGFREVWEVALGAELVSRQYVRLFEASRRRGERVIATPCPAIVSYVEKYMPELAGALAPIVSPMIAAGLAVRRRCGPDVRVVFVGPCIAKKGELRDASVRGIVDAALTYKELSAMLQHAGLDLAALPSSEFDSPSAFLARSFPISGGLLRTAGLSADILENDIVVTEGKERVLEALRDLAAGRSQARLLDVLFCEGCINGPKMLNELSVFARKEILAAHIRERNRGRDPRRLQDGLAAFADLPFERRFSVENLRLPQPDEEAVAAALRRMKKLDPSDQLNCGACGYATCREKAMAVCQGLAESEMCLPYLVEELESTCDNLTRSHRELEQAQQRLVQSERLASVGELSAGVAHELNNPLGSILIYSHLLLKGLKESDPRRADLEMVVSEASRCKHIVRGLLDFARRSRILKGDVDLERLLADTLRVMEAKAREAGVRLAGGGAAGLPHLRADGHQIKQVLVNLIDNGIDAARETQGEVRVTMGLSEDGRSVIVTVKDSGHGIPAADLPKLFTPFFTTKEPGRGTGLGLAISYGIIKMHGGDVTAESRPGEGTAFAIRLPVGEAASMGAGP